MRVKRQSTMRWEEAPDIISPEDLQKITGLGLQACRQLFDSPNFPAIPKKIIGNVSKADKEAVRMFLQGFNLKNNSKDVLLMMIYNELKKINKTNLEENDEEVEELY